MVESIVRFFCGQRLHLNKEEMSRLGDFYSRLVKIRDDLDEYYAIMQLINFYRIVSYEHDLGFDSFPPNNSILKLSDLVNKYGRNPNGKDSNNRTIKYEEVDENNVYLGGFDILKTYNTAGFYFDIYLEDPYSYSKAKEQAQLLIDEGLEELTASIEECMGYVNF